MAWIASLDIGGANVKACFGRFENARQADVQGWSVNHPIYRDPHGLYAVLATLRGGFEDIAPIDGVALTMTAELCDVFAGKEAGVRFVLEQVDSIFAGIPIYVWTVDAGFKRPEAIRAQPLLAAAANWLASAVSVAQSLAGRGAIWADMGSTTTDLLILQNGRVQSRSRTDLDRLLAGELLYTGALRTSLDTLLETVFIQGKPCHMAHEFFACAADLYRYLGHINEEDYDIPTPDGAGKSKNDCARRIARLVCADPEDLGEHGLRMLALQLAAAQLHAIENALLRLKSTQEAEGAGLIVAAGQGTFVLEQAAAALQMEVMPWWKLEEGASPSIAATTFSLARLLAMEDYAGV